MFWTVLIIYYSMQSLNITTLTHIAFSTERKCSDAMTPMLKIVQREYFDLTLGRNVNQQQHRQ
jgi:hypothetical protein